MLGFPFAHRYTVSVRKLTKGFFIANKKLVRQILKHFYLVLVLLDVVVAFTSIVIDCIPWFLTIQFEFFRCDSRFRDKSSKTKCRDKQKDRLFVNNNITLQIRKHIIRPSLKIDIPYEMATKSTKVESTIKRFNLILVKGLFDNNKQKNERYTGL